MIEREEKWKNKQMLKVKSEHFLRADFIDIRRKDYRLVFTRCIYFAILSCIDQNR